MPIKHHLDWSSYETAGQGDAYADIPSAGGDFAKAVAVCINDKLCQRTPKGVMCPSFRVTDDVAHSPGGRVMVLKAALNGEFGEDVFADPRLAASMELCLGCKGCKRECANQVDMAAIKIEYQAQRNERQGASRRDWLVARLPSWLRHRHVLSGLIRVRNRSPWLAKLGGRWFGIAANRQLPEPSATPYRPLPSSIESVANDRDVILFVDTFAWYFEPEIAQAANQVLTAAGYRVTTLQA